MNEIMVDESSDDLKLNQQNSKDSSFNSEENMDADKSLLDWLILLWSNIIFNS